MRVVHGTLHGGRIVHRFERNRRDRDARLVAVQRHLQGLEGTRCNLLPPTGNERVEVARTDDLTQRAFGYVAQG